MGRASLAHPGRARGRRRAALPLGQAIGYATLVRATACTATGMIATGSDVVIDTCACRPARACLWRSDRACGNAQWPRLNRQRA